MYMNLENYKKKIKTELHQMKSVIKRTKYLNDITTKLVKDITKIKKSCNKDYPGYIKYTPKTIDDLFNEMYKIFTSAPIYHTKKNPYNGLILLNLFIHMMVNKDGYLFFGDAIINQYLRNLLNLWKSFLDSPHSRYVLVKDGWLSENMIEDYKINKKSKYYGFKSWNDFFIRKFKDFNKSRPLGTNIMVSPCDFHIINFQKNIKLNGDYVMAKSDRYSLIDMLEGVDKNIFEKFINGTIVQGFLDAENYHRYHSPVDGKLVSAHLVNGTYFLIQYFDKLFCGQKQVIKSEEFLSNVQTRAIFIYKTRTIGYVAMICIGMVEVSSCIIRDELIGKMVKRGDEVGYFQYGGSTIALLFEKKYADKLKWNFKQKNFNIDKEPLIKVRSNFANKK